MRLPWLLIALIVFACQGEVLPEVQISDESNTAIWLDTQAVPTLEIRSASGIGEVTLIGDMPSGFLVRLHLNGLERFSLQAGDQRYELEYARSGVILSPAEATPLQLIQTANDQSGFLLSVKLRESSRVNQQIVLSWIDYFR